MKGMDKYELADLQKGIRALELHEKHPLEVYRPTEFQLPIHESSSSEVVVIGGKRAGKTLAVCCEFASRILGIPIKRADGTVIPLRYRKPTKRNPGLYWVIGLDVKHIGQTIYHRLFSPGLGCNFRIIEENGKWVAFNPNLHGKRFDESELSPPLLGENIIDPKSWHFESRAGNIFHSLNLKNNVTICAYATTGDHPKQGDAVDGIWLDEDTANAEFLKEWQDRLISVRGWFLWSVWPKVANEALIKTLDRAKRHEDDEKPPIKVVQLIGSDNPYSDRQGIAEGLDRMDDEDDEAHRDRGDISAFISGRRMYDFGAAYHIIKPPDEVTKKPDNAWEMLGKLLKEDPSFPKTWTRYLIIDPSHTRTACLFGVVPPPEWEQVEIGSRLIIYRELVVKKHTPSMFAEALLPNVLGLHFEAFVMDQMVGRQTTVGNDITVFQSYENQFRARGIVSRITASGFMRGCNDKSLRRRTVRDMLEPTEGGLPRLLVSYKCQQTIKEFYNYRKKEITDSTGLSVPTDDPVNERVFDCMAAIEYAAQYVNDRFRDGTAYVDPENFRSTGSLAYHAAMKMRAELEKTEPGYVHMGPGAAA